MAMLATTRGVISELLSPDLGRSPAVMKHGWQITYRSSSIYRGYDRRLCPIHPFKTFKPSWDAKISSSLRPVEPVATPAGVPAVNTAALRAHYMTHGWNPEKNRTVQVQVLGCYSFFVFPISFSGFQRFHPVGQLDCVHHGTLPRLNRWDRSWELSAFRGAFAAIVVSWHFSGHRENVQTLIKGRFMAS